MMLERRAGEFPGFPGYLSSAFVSLPHAICPCVCLFAASPLVLVFSCIPGQLVESLELIFN